MITALLIVAALISLVLGGIVIFQQPRVLAAIFFFTTMIGTAVWAVGIAAFLEGDSETVLIQSAKIYYIAAAMIGWSTLGFALTFVQRHMRHIVRYLSYLTLPFVALSSVIFFYPHLLITNVELANTNTALLDPTFYAIYVVYFAAYYMTALAVLWRRSHNKSQVLRKHFSYIFMAYSLAGAIGMLFNLFLPAFGNYQLIWAGPLGLLLFVPIVFIAIAKHGLFDIRQTVIRSVAYAFSLIVLAAIYYVLAYIVSVTLFQGETTTVVSISPINIALALVLAFVFQPIKNFFDRITDNIFFRDRYNSDEFYARLSEVLTTTTDLRNLLQRAAREIASTLKSKQAFFFVKYNHTHHVTAGTAHHAGLPVHDAHAIDEYVKKHGSDVLVTELLTPGHHIRRLLVSHRIALLMPLMREDTPLGYLALGDHQSSGFTNRDIKVLKTVSDELLIAIQNALSVQEVRDINANLQQRIDAATAELRTSNARLRRLDAAKDEFLSMASHQLRTPLTSVKGYLSMVLEGDVGRITKTQRELLSEAFTSSERMVHLIHDFLNVSRLQTGKFALERGEYDLQALVKSEVASLQQVAASRQMKLEFVDKAGPTVLNIDETKVQQVVMNYIDNAIYYSHSDTTISVELEKMKDAVVLRVKDTGIGVPESEQAQLFSKFYRASNARKQRPDGTGVGLYLAQKVISAHGGKVLFESKEGKGSMFGFQLPLENGAK